MASAAMAGIGSGSTMRKKTREVGRPVQVGRLEQVARQSREEVAQQEDSEGQAVGRVRDPDPGVAVDAEDVLPPIDPAISVSRAVQLVVTSP